MTTCPNCEQYEGDRLSNHWTQNESCSAPEPSQYQKELFTGLLLGDGCVRKMRRNSRLEIIMINRRFLEWVDNELGIFTTGGVNIERTAAENFSRMNDGDFSNATRVENYHPTYRLQSKCIPWLNTLQEWYSEGEKKFPEDLGLTPTIAKMWYVCDGGLNNSNKQPATCEITSKNESDRAEYLTGLFEDVGFNVTFSGGTIRFRSDDTDDFLDWMGGPVPGFDYKWETDYWTYQDLKERAYDQ